MFLMEPNDFANIDVSDAVTVGDKESIAIHVLFDLLYATASHGVGAGIRQGNVEVLFIVRIMECDLVFAAKANCEIVVHRLVVKEIFLDHVSSISEANQKIPKTVMRVKLHDVPQNW